ncbi:hypothetical protein [Salinisphaera sp. T31B1]|uniref:Uncharacterized protein n=1 Tax=Salinisphaera aquimarina TaxID=2094031 RepID=A0ABV7EV48_9GAMM
MSQHAPHPIDQSSVYHENVEATRQGATDAIHDVFRRARVNLYDEIRREQANGGRTAKALRTP